MVHYIHYGSRFGSNVVEKCLREARRLAGEATLSATDGAEELGATFQSTIIEEFLADGVIEQLLVRILLPCNHVLIDGF